MRKTLIRTFSVPSIRIKTLVAFEVTFLLLASLGVLFYFTRQALVEEAKKDAEQRLECTVQHVDNVLLSVEQSAGNFYYELVENLDHPERMMSYCRRLVECNSNIEGCAIAMEPNYYPDREQFITYVHRKKYNSPELIMAEKSVNTPYTQQKWYKETMATCRPSWIVPTLNKEYNLEPLVIFCLPIRDYSSKECVGVVAVGLSINLLSQIVLEDKPSPNSYSMLLDHEGHYIMHPNRAKLSGHSVFTEPDVTESPSALAAAQSMLSQKTGNTSFRLNGFTWYLFFKPFVRTDIPGRSLEALNWSIGTVYPKSDIFGEYNHLVFHVLAIALAGLLIFFILSRFTVRYLVRPLIQLTEIATGIAEGHYEESISDTKRTDEVGLFQQNFLLMQKALASDISQQEQLQTTLRERHEEVERIHKQIKEDDNVKTTFLHNVTDRMIAPSQSIYDSVTNLCDNYNDITLQEAEKEMNNINQQSMTILGLLSQKFSTSYKRTGKEESHE